MPSYFFKFLNIIFLCVLFQVFSNTPLYFLDTYLSLLCIMLSFLFIGKKFLFRRNVFYNTSRKMVILFLLLMLVGIIAAIRMFHQSLADCLSANISILQIFILAFYAYIFSRNKIPVKHFEKVFIIFMLLDVLVLILFYNYKATGVSDFSGQQLKFTAQFLPKNFIHLGVFYFFILFLKKNNFAYAFISVFLLLLPNLLIYFERGYFAVTVMLLLLAFVFFRKSNSVVNKVFIAFCALLLSLIIIANLSDTFANIETRYSSILQGLESGKSDDPSVNYRFTELRIALGFFYKSPLIGSGRIKSSNVQKFAGANYFPSDVGVAGILGTYGITGMLTFIYLFIISIRVCIRVLKKSKKYSALTICLGVYIFSLIIESIQTANVILNPAFWSFLYLILLYSAKIDEERNALSAIEKESIDLKEISHPQYQV